MIHLSYIIFVRLHKRKSVKVKVKVKKLYTPPRMTRISRFDELFVHKTMYRWVAVANYTASSTTPLTMARIGISRPWMFSPKKSTPNMAEMSSPPPFLMATTYTFETRVIAP